MKRWDKYAVTVIIILIVLSIGVYYLINLNKPGDLIVIKQNGKIIKEIDLKSVETEYQTELDCGNGERVVIGVEKNGAKFLSSTCKDKLCVKHGLCKNAGDFAACLPNRVSISVEGEAAPDNISR